MAERLARRDTDYPRPNFALNFAGLRILENNCQALFTDGDKCAMARSPERRIAPKWDLQAGLMLFPPAKGLVPKEP